MVVEEMTYPSEKEIKAYQKELEEGVPMFGPSPGMNKDRKTLCWTITILVLLAVFLDIRITELWDKMDKLEVELTDFKKLYIDHRHRYHDGRIF